MILNSGSLSPELQHALERACDDLNHLLGEGERITPERLIVQFTDLRQLEQIYDPQYTTEELRKVFLKNSSSQTVISSPVLVARGLAAFGKWAQAGFSMALPEQRERRLAACRSCEHYIDAPQKWFYNAVHAGKICRLCGCSLDKKIRLATENCPAPDAVDAKQSKWGESIAR